MKKILLSVLFLGILIFPSYVHADPPTLNIPPTNAFDKIRADNGSITAQNFSMPLIVKGGSGIQVKSNNSTHTLQISSSISQATGTYNITQANNVNKNTGGYQLNFINGTGATVNVQNSHSGNQVNVTVSATGVSSGVTSLNALTGALTIACVTGNTTCTTSGGNTITINTAYNVVMTNSLPQTITKGITHTADITMSGANINLASNIIKTTNYNILQYNDPLGLNGIRTIGNSKIINFITASTNGSTSRQTGFVLARVPYTSGTWEELIIGSDVVSGNGSLAYEIRASNGGNGEAVPINIWQTAQHGGTQTKELSFDPVGTITNYVDTLFKTKITQYNSINTAGWGVPAIYGSGRLTGLTGASGTVTSYTVGGSDGTFEISGDILCTTSTSYDFLEQVTYTDETGATRTVNLMFTLPSTSAPTPFIRNLSGPIFLGLPMTIHAKSGTAITIATNPAGTYTTVTYNIDGIIKQIA